MPRNRHIHRGWQCDNCSELIRSYKTGRVEWLCDSEDRISGLRLVHSRASNPGSLTPYGCEYDPREEFRKNGSLVEGLSLGAFAGADGLVLMLSKLALPEYPTEQLIELVKRIHIPGYEEARDLFQRAISEQVLVPAIGPGYYLQSEILGVLRGGSGRGRTQ